MFCVLAFVRLWQKEVRPHGLIRRVVVVVKKKRGTKSKSKREIDQMSNVKKTKNPYKTEEQKKFWNATTVVIKNCVLVPWYFVVITKRRTS